MTRKIKDMQGWDKNGKMPYTTHLTKENLLKICDNLALGMPKSYAAPDVGISAATLYRWEREYPFVKDAVAAAEASDIRKCLECIDAALVSEDERLAVSAAQWKLKYRYRFSETVNVNHGTQDDESVTVYWSRLKELSDDDYATFIRIYQFLTQDTAGDLQAETEPMYIDVEAEVVEPGEEEG